MTEQVIQFVRKPKYSKIGKDKVVSLKYALFDDSDNKILEYRDDLTYLHGGYGGAFTKVEEDLEGLEIGMKSEVILKPEESFGVFDHKLVITQPAEDFPPETQELGSRLDGEAPDGHIVKFIVTKVDKGLITVNGNHPYAGKTVKFVFEVLDIRTATNEELELGKSKT